MLFVTIMTNTKIEMNIFAYHFSCYLKTNDFNDCLFFFLQLLVCQLSYTRGPRLQKIRKFIWAGNTNLFRSVTRPVYGLLLQWKTTKYLFLISRFPYGLTIIRKNVKESNFDYDKDHTMQQNVSIIFFYQTHKIFKKKKNWYHYLFVSFIQNVCRYTTIVQRTVTIR